ncbi:MAG: PAS domain S-box protein [Chloroflexi bacterium]|nr:PAS domain S-box protein [Chloroflexota bacterium]
MVCPTKAGTKAQWLALIATLVVVFLAVKSLLTLSEPPEWAMRSVPTQDGQLRITWVMPMGYAWISGLRAGDIVRPAPAPVGAAARHEIEVVTGENAGRTASVPSYSFGAIDAGLMVMGIEWLIAGLIVYLRSPKRHAAGRFFVLTIAVAITLQLGPAYDSGRVWARYLEIFSMLAGVAAFAFFFLTTPVQRWRPLRQALIGVLPFLLAAYTYSVLADPAAYEAFKRIAFVYIAVCLLAGAVALVSPFFARASGEQRQLWPVALTSAFATMVFVAGSMLPYLLFQRFLLQPELAVLAWSLVPIGFAWSFMKHRLFGVRLGPWAVIRTVFDTITDPIFVVNRDGRLVDASRAGLSMLGIEQVSQASELFSCLAAKWEIPRRSGVSLTGGLLQRVFDGAAVRDDQQSLILPRDEVGLVSVSGTPVFDERGQVDLAVLVYRDLSESSRAEKALRQSEAKYRSLFKHANDYIFIVSPADGRLLDVNDKASEKLGYSHEELLQLTIYDLDTPETRQGNAEAMRELFENGSVVAERRHRRKDGTEFPVEISCRLVDYDGRRVIQSFIRDITQRKEAEQNLEESFRRLQRALDGTIHAMALIVEKRDPYTAGHQERVAMLASAIAGEMGLSGEQRSTVRLAATIHDIGKVNVPSEILSKPSRLSSVEFDLVKSHCQVGCDVLTAIEIPTAIPQITLQHHERLDGSGYPSGLKGQHILLEAKILAVADVVEAMASHRPYRPALGIEKALDEITMKSGRLYDPEVAVACAKLFGENRFEFAKRAEAQPPAPLPI